MAYGMMITPPTFPSPSIEAGKAGNECYERDRHDRGGVIGGMVIMLTAG